MPVDGSATTDGGLSTSFSRESENVTPGPEEQTAGQGGPGALNSAACQGEDVDRRAQDQELVEQLRKVGFEGPEYDIFERELVGYGWAVLDAWLRHGQIFERCASIGRAINPTSRERDQLAASKEDREELSATVVGFVISNFRHIALAGGGWRPDGGASLSTYFVNRLVREFPNHFRAWQAQNRRWEQSREVTHDRLVELPDPASIAAERDVVLADLVRLRPREREVVALHYDGYSHAEIVELTGAVSEKAVEGVLSRWRKKERARRSGESHG
jgi:hypothetical protein